MKKLRALLFLAALAPGIAHAQSADWQKTWNATLAAARKEGKVVVAAPPDTQVRQLLPAAFEARYGITMEYISGRGTDQTTKLRRERTAGIYSVDAVVAGNQTMFSVLLGEKMLAPLKPELILPEVTDGSKWKRGSLWFPDPEQKYILRIFNTVRDAFMINTDVIKPQDLRRIRDVLDPKWRGKISFLDPTLAGTGGNHATLLYAQLGEDFIKKLFIGQKPMITRERRQLTDGLLRGTYPISFGAEGGEIERMKAEGLPVLTITSLEDMPGAVSGGNMVALMDQVPHPNAARIFVNWMASKEATEIYGRALNMVPARSDTDDSFAPAEAIPKAGVSYFDTYDYNFTVITNEEARRRVRDLLRGR